VTSALVIYNKCISSIAEIYFQFAHRYKISSVLHCTVCFDKSVFDVLQLWSELNIFVYYVWSCIILVSS